MRFDKSILHLPWYKLYLSYLQRATTKKVVAIYHPAKNNNLSIPWVTKMATKAEVSRGSSQWQHTTPKSDASHPPAHLLIFPLTNLL